MYFGKFNGDWQKQYTKKLFNNNYNSISGGQEEKNPF